MRLLALQLDFKQTPARYPVWGSLLMLLAVLIWVVIIFRAQDLSTQIDTESAKLARAEKRERQPGMATVDPETLAQEIKTANSILQQLALPWQDLFNAVEAANHKDISLLAIQPEPDKQSVRLQGEAKNLNAVLQYIDQLELSAALSQVYLLNHEIKQQDPERPVLFMIAAKWSRP